MKTTAIATAAIISIVLIIALLGIFYQGTTYGKAITLPATGTFALKEGQQETIRTTTASYTIQLDKIETKTKIQYAQLSINAIDYKILQGQTITLPTKETIKLTRIMAPTAEFQIMPASATTKILPKKPARQPYTLNEGQSIQIVIDNFQYDLTVTQVSSLQGYAIFDINGQVTPQIAVTEIYQLSNSATIETASIMGKEVKFYFDPPRKIMCKRNPQDHTITLSKGSGWLMVHPLDPNKSYGMVLTFFGTRYINFEQAVPIPGAITFPGTVSFSPFTLQPGQTHMIDTDLEIELDYIEDPKIAKCINCKTYAGFCKRTK